VMLTHKNMVSAANAITEYLDNASNDIILNVHPLSFDYGLYQVLMTFKVGGTLILKKNFGYPYALLKQLHDEKVTGFPIVPTMAILLSGLGGVSDMKFPHLRFITNTSDSLHVKHIEILRKLFPTTDIFSMYGLTECKRVSYLPPTLLSDKPTSVGVPMPHTKVFIVDRNGNVVGPHTEGELVVQGPTVMKGYWNNTSETAKRLRRINGSSELSLFTNDIFTKDEEGFLYFKRRNSDLIKVKGERISPKEIEQTILMLDGVKGVLVTGVPDYKLGNKIKAVIVPDRDAELSTKTILSHCSKYLEDTHVPHIIDFQSQLPMSLNGKLIRQATVDSDESQFIQLSHVHTK